MIFKKKHSIFERLSFSQYEKLDPEKREEVDYILENFLKPCADLKVKKHIIKPKRNNIWSYLYEEIIDLRTYAANGDIENLVRRYNGYEGKKDLDVYNYLGVVKHITDQLKQIMEAEKRLEGKKDKKVWEKAGIDRLNQFDNYLGVLFATENILEEDKILKLPFHQVFRRNLFNKVWGEVQEEFMNLKSKNDKK